MKKIISLVLFVFTIASYSQEKTISQTDTNSPTSTENYRKGVTIGKWTTVSFSSGISTPSSNFSDNAYTKNGTYLELAGAYYFSKFGIGVSVGQLSSPTNKNFSSSINSVDIPTTSTTQNWKQFYYGIGPEYKAQFGNFSATFSTKIGLQSVKSINLESNYANGKTPIAILKIKSDKTSSLSYFSTDLRFGYNISSNFNLYATVNYMSALSNGITISKSKISDSNKNGIIDAEDLKFATGSATIDYETSTQNIKPQSTNFGIGLSYRFGSKKGYDYYKAKADNTKRKRPGRITYNNITLERSQANDGGNDENTTKTVNLKKLADELVNLAAKDKDSFGNINWNVKENLSIKKPSRTGRNPQTGATIQIAAKKVVKFKAGRGLSQRVHKPSDAHHENTTKTANLKKLADELVNLAVKENPHPHGNNEKYADLKKLADELVNLAVKGNSHSHGDNLKYADLKKLADELVNLAAKDKDSVGNINWNIKENLSIKKPSRTGRNPQTGATIKGIVKNDSKSDGDGKILQGYTKESTMIFVRVDESSLRNSNTKIPKDKLIQESDKRMSKRSLRNRKRHGDKRYRERAKPRTLRSADKRYRERAKPRTLRSADKRYRERVKPRTLRSADKRYRERTKPRTLRSADKRYRERAKPRTLRSADKRYRERVKPRTLRSADKRYRERTKTRTLRSADKRYRERTKERTLRSADKRYRERAKPSTLRSADKRYRKKIRRYRMKNNKNTIQNDKPVKITTEENNKVNPSTNLATRFLKAQNYQTIQISRSEFQLTAPLLISKNQTDLISYNWTIKNKTKNKEDKFTGKTINYNFDVSGTYEIEIIPVVNNKNLNSYHITIICN